MTRLSSPLLLAFLFVFAADTYSPSTNKAYGSNDFRDADRDSISTDSGSFTATFASTPFSTSYGITVNYRRVQDVVTLMIGPAFHAASGSATTSAVANAAIPSGIRPTAQVRNAVVPIFNNASKATPGLVQLDTNGTITVFVDSTFATNWMNSGNIGWEQFTISYIK